MSRKRKSVRRPPNLAFIFLSHKSTVCLEKILRTLLVLSARYISSMLSLFRHIHITLILVFSCHFNEVYAKNYIFYFWMTLLCCTHYGIYILYILKCASESICKIKKKSHVFISTLSYPPITQYPYQSKSLIYIILLRHTLSFSTLCIV